MGCQGSKFFLILWVVRGIFGIRLEIFGGGGGIVGIIGKLRCRQLQMWIFCQLCSNSAYLPSSPQLAHISVSTKYSHSFPQPYSLPPKPLTPDSQSTRHQF